MLHSHTQLDPNLRDCQVAPVNSQAKTWQRVCLSHRTKDSETHDRQERQHLTVADVIEGAVLRRYICAIFDILLFFYKFNNYITI